MNEDSPAERNRTARMIAVGDVCDGQRALECRGAVWLRDDTGWNHRELPGTGSPADVAQLGHGRIVIVGDASCGRGCPADARRVATAWVTAPVAPGTPEPTPTPAATPDARAPDGPAA